jgi:hypothetical protein
MTPDEFKGYDAAALGQPFDRNQSVQWRAGWRKYHDDMTRSESVRFV